MSASNQPVPAGTKLLAKPRSMSSRLLTMKFMQRAAAAAASSSSSPAAPTQNSSGSDPEALKRALAEENAKREAALRAQEKATSRGDDAETRWELSYVRRLDAGEGGMQVVGMGYGEIAQENEERRNSGRMAFGGFKRKGEPAVATPVNEEEEGEEETNGDPAAPAKILKDVSLRGLTSISNAPQSCRTCGGLGHMQAECPEAMCFACGENGHMSMSCPSKKGKKREGEVGDDRPGKRR